MDTDQPPSEVPELNRLPPPYVGGSPEDTLERLFYTGEVSVWSRHQERVDKRRTNTRFNKVSSANARGRKIVKFVCGYGNSWALTMGGDVINLSADEPHHQTHAQSKCFRHNQFEQIPFPSGKQLAQKLHETEVLFQDVAIGKGFAAGVGLEDDRLYTWGVGVQGQLGIGHTRGSTLPVQVPMLSHQAIKQVACGESHLVALSKEGHVFTCGRGFEGQLGQGIKEEANLLQSPQMAVKLAPKFVQSLLNVKIMKVACGHRFTAAICSDGGVWTWGEGLLGQLGDGRCTKRTVPGLVFGPKCEEEAEATILSEYEDIMLEHRKKLQEAVARERERKMKKMHDENSSLSSDDEMDSIPDTQMDNLALAGASRGTVGFDGEEGHLAEGKDRVAGDGVEEEPFDFAAEEEEQKRLEREYAEKQQELIDQRFVVDIVCGYGHVLALNRTGSLVVWGFNQYGQLGLGDAKTRFLPVTQERFSESRLDTISCGNHTSGAINVNGQAFTWGMRLYDQNEESAAESRPGTTATAWGEGKNAEEEESKATDILRIGADQHNFLVPTPVAPLENQHTTMLVVSNSEMLSITPTNVSSIAPLTGGIVGGTKLYIYGSGLWDDARIRVLFNPIYQESDYESEEESLSGDEDDDADSKMDDDMDDDLDDSGSSDGESYQSLIDDRVPLIVQGFYDAKTGAVWCYTPEFSIPGDVKVEVAIDGENFTSNGKTFSYFELPFVNGVFPAWAPFGQDTLCTLRGTGFKAAKSLMVRLRVIEPTRRVEEDDDAKLQANDESESDENREDPRPERPRTNDIFLPARYVTVQEQQERAANAPTPPPLQKAGTVAKLSKSMSTKSMVSAVPQLSPTIEFTIPADMHFDVIADEGDVEDKIEDQESINEETVARGVPSKNRSRQPAKFQVDVALNGIDFTDDKVAMTISELQLDGFSQICAPCTFPVGDTPELTISGSGIVKPKRENLLLAKFVVRLPGHEKDPKRVRAFAVKSKRKVISATSLERPLADMERAVIQCQIPKLGSNIFHTVGLSGGKLVASVEVSLNGGLNWVECKQPFTFYSLEILSVSPLCGSIAGGNVVNLRIAEKKPDTCSTHLSTTDLQRFFDPNSVKVKLLVEGKKNAVLNVNGKIDGGVVKFTMPKVAHLAQRKAAIASKSDDTSRPATVGPTAIAKIRIAVNGNDYTEESVKYSCYEEPTLEAVEPCTVELTTEGESGTSRPAETKFTIHGQGVYDTGSLFVSLEEQVLEGEGELDEEGNKRSKINYITEATYDRLNNEIKFPGLSTLSRPCKVFVRFSMNGVTYSPASEALMIDYTKAASKGKDKGKKKSGTKKGKK